MRDTGIQHVLLPCFRITASKVHQAAAQTPYSFFFPTLVNFLCPHSFDFLIYNLLGHSSYAIFNCAFYYSKTVQDIYKAQHQGSTNDVQVSCVRPFIATLRVPVRGSSLVDSSPLPSMQASELYGTRPCCSCNRCESEIPPHHTQCPTWNVDCQLMAPQQQYSVPQSLCLCVGSGSCQHWAGQSLARQDQHGPSAAALDTPELQPLLPFDYRIEPQFQPNFRILFIAPGQAVSKRNFGRTKWKFE